MAVTSPDAEVKVEVNFVFRGTVLAPVRTALTAAAQEKFSANIEVPVLATAELYASKLVAALDRQHPRDLFDVKLMFSRFGLPADFLDCFVVYLAGHNRPTHEVLFPNEHDIDAIFAAEFTGMTAVPVSLAELKATRKKLMAELPAALSERQRGFLAPRRFVWKETVKIAGRRRARWACGQAAFEPVHMSTGRFSGAWN